MIPWTVVFGLGDLHGKPSHFCYACVLCDGHASEVLRIPFQNTFSHWSGCVMTGETIPDPKTIRGPSER
jgi:hypothetical protein